VIKKYLLFLSISILCLNLSFTQEKNSSTSLLNVLQTLEDSYNLAFSYADNLVKDVVLETPNYKNSAASILKYIETNTSLVFVIISKNNYAIISSENGLSENTTQNLEEVVVNSYLTKGISLNIDGSTTIIPKSFGILPGLINPDILQAIQALPGITSVDERISDINVRGGTNDQNLILWEGIRMYQTGHFFGLISAFDPYLTKRVTVYKNGTSALFGGSVSSVISLENDSEISNKLSAGIGLNFLNLDSYGIVPLNDKLELQLSARRSITDTWQTPTYKSYYKRVFQDTDLTDNNNNAIAQNDTFYFYDISTKLNYKISDKDQLTFSAISIVNDLLHQETNTESGAGNQFNSTLNQNSLAATISYKRTWTPKLHSQLSVYRSNYRLEAKNFDITNAQKLIQQNEVLELGLKLHVNYNWSPNLNYLGGYQLSEIGISNLENVNNPLFRRLIKEVNRTHSIFNELKYNSPSKKTVFKLGLRHNYFEKFAVFNTEPRLSFNQKLSQHFRLEILGELKSQTTSQIIDLQNDFLGVEKRRWVLANNESIPITKSGQISAGIHFNKNKLLISLEGYFKEVRGMSTRSQGFQNQFQFTDATGNYSINGVDFLINKKFNKINTWFSYAFSENNYTFDALNNTNSFPNSVGINHAITVAGNYDWKNLKIGLGFNWRTGKPFTSPQNNVPNPENSIIFDAPNANNLPDYLRLDLSANYVFSVGKTMKATTGFSLWNITNTSNILNRYYTIDSSNTINQTDNQSLGITPNLSLRIDF
jgi:hypothetical protein